MPGRMIVLGIDPGIANTGYGVVARRGGRLVALDGGVIESPADLALERRLALIHDRIDALLGEHQPTAMALEELYFGANAHSAFAVGQARGAVMLAAGRRGIACFGYTPQQVKSAVCGSGRAGKAQVQRMVQALLALDAPPAPDHAADALAVAVCHANRAAVTDAVRQPARGRRRGSPLEAAIAAADARAAASGTRVPGGAPAGVRP
jgi:crossover junction endodeoxyribonuclease RuvC